MSRKQSTRKFKNIILVSHNNRMRCFLSTITDNYAKIRFMNCAILKLNIQPRVSTLSLIYEGEVANKRGGYFITQKEDEDEDKNDVEDVLFPIMKFPTSLLNVSVMKYNYCIYIIRHGESTHNVKWALPIYRDTSLTKIGLEQAENAADFLHQYLKNKKLDYMFCSKLKRTRETLLQFVEAGIINSNKKMIVLPCSHEIKLNKNCYNSVYQGIIALENRKSCNNEKNFKENDNCKSIKSTYKSIHIYWDLYKKYKNNCENNNMLNILIEYINK